MPEKPRQITVLTIEGMNYARRLTANSLQGLVNRRGALLYLDYGSYDDPSTRRTNSVQMTEEDWFNKYRAVLLHNDQDNLAYFKHEFQLEIETLDSLESAIRIFRDDLQGMVIWDPELPDSINLALIYAGLHKLLVVHPDDADKLGSIFALPVVQDLRRRFSTRLDLYQWAFKNLFTLCTRGKAAHYEPAWQRAEFTDYIVQQNLFTFCLSCHEKKSIGSFGQKLLLLLIGGPLWLRNLLFDTRLDAFVRWCGLRLQEVGTKEVALGNRIQRHVRKTCTEEKENPKVSGHIPFKRNIAHISEKYPTIFGWHSDRDDELAFMLAISANGLRLAPSFLASNFSFHSKLDAKIPFKQQYRTPDQVELEKKIYLTFTLSDGDQLTLMNTAELGNWRREERGKVPFNWEVQPLLVEISPAMLGFYYQHLSDADMLVAGPSGAGYVIPPLVPDLQSYLNASSTYCDRADIRITTSYTSNPPRRVLRDHGHATGNFLGFIAGYFHLNKTPMEMAGGKPFVSYAWPHVTQIGLPAEEVLKGIRELIEAPGKVPRFIACHLFAYRTTVTDVYQFVQSLDPERVKVVRADEFLYAAEKFMQKEKRS